MPNDMSNFTGPTDRSVIECPPVSNNSNNSTHMINNQQQQQQAAQSNDKRSPLAGFYWALTRKKPLDRRTETNLNRCLGLLDLTTLGVGSTLGLGLYVLAGNVASAKAGPAVILSFAFAALASAFSALCYAEFAGLVPRAGSAYVYSYITVGEFAAFFIGWNLILEYAIGAAAVTRGFSDHIKTLYKHLSSSSSSSSTPTLIESISNQNQSHFVDYNNNNDHRAFFDNNDRNFSAILNDDRGYNETTLMTSMSNEAILGCVTPEKESFKFDAIPFIIVAIITIPIAVGAKCSTRVTLLFTAINLMVVTCVIVSGLTTIDGFKNWQLSPDQVHGHGSGGFMPFGWAGVFAGASTCFFGFIGFDTIASSAEEARNPKRNVPLSIILSLIISTMAYMSIATVQTLAWPYYDQQCETVLPYIFKSLDMPVTYWIVTIGALAGLASSQLAGMIPLPRTLYSMASDRLIYGYLSKVSKRLKIPLRAVIIGNVLVAPLAATVETDTLANMVSIGTLAAYTIVSLSVLILRYEEHQESVDDKSIIQNHINFVEIFETLDEQQQQQRIEPLPMTNLKDDDDTTLHGNGVLTNGYTGDKNSHVDPDINLKLKRSRMLKPQLSIGFQSWFKSSTNQEANLNCIDGANHHDHVVGSSSCKQDNQRLTMFKLIYELMTRDPRFPNIDRCPNDQTSYLSKILITAMVLLCTSLDVIAYICINSERDNPLGKMIGFSSINLLAGSSIIIVLLASTIILLSRLPTNNRLDTDSFRVPLVPWIPILSIMVNVYLMLSLDVLVWIRFLAWMAVGFFIYFSYGIWNSIGFMVSNIELH